MLTILTAPVNFRLIITPNDLQTNHRMDNQSTKTYKIHNTRKINPNFFSFQYAIKLGNKRSEKRLSAIIELTTIMVEDKLPKIDTGQIEEIKRDERERDWKYKNNNHHNHTANVSTFFCCFFGLFYGSLPYYSDWREN